MPKTVLITGGSSGIGAAMVRGFREAGYHVWFTYNTGKDRADALLASLPNPGDAQAFFLRLGDLDSHRAFVSTLPGPVDILLNNAGLGTKTVEAVADEPPRQDEALMVVNAIGTLWLTQDLLPGMLERGFGKVILLSSVSGGITHFPSFRVADGMSKASIAYLGRHLQALHARDPIDVFTICPGATDTPMFQASTLNPLTDAEREVLVDGLPGRRLITPEEIASLALWLCTDDAQVLRGAVLDASLGLGVRPNIERKQS